MKEYIEKEAALNELQSELAYDPDMYINEHNKYIDFGLKIAIRDIEFQPAADVVEVVRCKDCTEYNGHRYCHYHADPVDDNDFCSYGERKTV